MAEPLSTHTLETQRPHRIAARNRALAARFVVLHHTRCLRQDYVYRKLAAEFFLTEKTVVRILRRVVREP